MKGVPLLVAAILLVPGVAYAGEYDDPLFVLANAPYMVDFGETISLEIQVFNWAVPADADFVEVSIYSPPRGLLAERVETGKYLVN